MGGIFSGIGNFLGSLFDPPQQQQYVPPPAPPPPPIPVAAAVVPEAAPKPVMPIPDDKETRRAQDVSIAARRRNVQTRQNSVLSQADSGDKLGG